MTDVVYVLFFFFDKAKEKYCFSGVYKAKGRNKSIEYIYIYIFVPSRYCVYNPG